MSFIFGEKIHKADCWQILLKFVVLDCMNFFFYFKQWKIRVHMIPAYASTIIIINK